jgi:hypothetical protein
MLNVNDQYGSFVPKTNLNNLYGLVIPHSGHTLSDALKDLVDNSFDAGAKKISIHLNGSSDLKSYWIVDNGRGMNSQVLKGALTFSAGSIHDAGDLGKFSIGGTTACCTLGLTRIVFTKQADGELLVGAQDFRNVVECTEIRQPTPAESKWFKSLVGDHGTIIEICDLREDKIEYFRIGDLKNALVKDFGETFYQMLSTKRSLNVVTSKGSYQAQPQDPLFYKTDPKKVLAHKKYTVPFAGSEIYVRTSVIDTQQLEFGSKGYQYQGVYFSRNNRLITRGIGVKGLWKKNPRKNAGRIEISFGEDLDAHFGLTATKNKVSLSQSLTDTLENTIKIFVSTLEEKWRKTTDLTSDEIGKENESFSTALVNNTGIIGLPKDESSSGQKQVRGKKKDGKKGAIKPKGTGITRAGKSVMVPKFVFENHKRVTDAYWSEFPEEGGMQIVVNLSHAFIREHWTNGTKEQRDLMRKILTATCLAQFRKKETNHEIAAQSFMRDLFDELTNIQLALGK